ncbi:MAG: metal-dependent transcriptional regulator [Saprospiraceae bacterium]|nr:metal-dependent transcriptional regulator [Saprospiraceae bacterium]
MKLTESEEDHIRVIFYLFERTGQAVSTNAISDQINTTPASVTDMIKRLSSKGLVTYRKYYGVTLNAQGNTIATNLIRKNRLWKVMLTQRLNFNWTEVEDLADQLEHIHSDKLINEIDQILKFPKYDVFGDPIPDESGKYILRSRYPLTEISFGQQVTIVGVLNHKAAFLTHLNNHNLNIGSEIIILEKFEFDQSYLILHKGIEKQLSKLVARNILVRYNNRIDHPQNK